MAEFETVTVNGQQEKTVDGNKNLSNVLYDCTAPDAAMAINVRDSASVTNVGFKGKNQASKHDSDNKKFGFHVNASGEVLLDTIYLGDGSQEGHNCPLFLNRQSTGSLTVRHYNVQNFPDNGLYLSTPAKEGGACEVHIRNSYARNCVSGIYRVCNGTMQNCVAVSDARPPAKLRGQDRGPGKPKGSPVYGHRQLWGRNGAQFEATDCTFWKPHESGAKHIRSDNGGSITAINCKFGPMDPQTEGNVNLQNPQSISSAPPAPTGVPLTAEEAASGEASADGTTIPPGSVAGSYTGGTGGGTGVFVGGEVDSPMTERFVESVPGKGRVVRLGKLEEDELP